MTKIVWMVDGITVVSADELPADGVKQISEYVEQRVQGLERFKQSRARTRARIKSQIDHAYITGEPVAKFITCIKCERPATHLSLSQPLNGADTLDEELIIAAGCCSKLSFGVSETVPCNSLEFFYNGVRLIGVKRREQTTRCKGCECCEEAF